jgi:hypothetical protein
MADHAHPDRARQSRGGRGLFIPPWAWREDGANAAETMCELFFNHMQERAILRALLRLKSFLNFLRNGG